MSYQRETCQTYKPWHDKVSHKNYLKSDQGKRLHYYFYFSDPEIGFGYVRQCKKSGTSMSEMVDEYLDLLQNNKKMERKNWILL